MQTGKRRDSEMYDSDPVQMKDCVVELPPPDQLGAGHPFLLFLCFSLLKEYKDELMRTVQDPTDVIHFYQSMKKRHDAIKILNRARRLFDRYMRDQDIRIKRLFPEVSF
ncbi:hypothetical protein Ciccas_001992 [Cichlidogyrus casuarinus]|uniref:Uncharacterized protein n=1 Tax=Cichlidogyrus casuarinus TaxID=1844966 RepID=A0ABD2QIU7_9PLAT